MKSIWSLILATLLVVPAIHAFDYLVSFGTTDCNGDTGFVSVDVRQIYKIRTIPCEQEIALKQALIRKQDGNEAYDVVTLTEAEARSLQEEIRIYTKARREVLQNSGALILGN